MRGSQFDFECNSQFLYMCAKRSQVVFGERLGIANRNIALLTADQEGIAKLMGRVSKAMQAYTLGDVNFAKHLRLK